MFKEVDQLRAREIDWNPIADRPYHFAARVDDMLCELRLNDFLDENIATLWIRGEKFELDEFPKPWRLPKHRGE